MRAGSDHIRVTLQSHSHGQRMANLCIATCTLLQVKMGNPAFVKRVADVEVIAVPVPVLVLVPVPVPVLVLVSVLVPVPVTRTCGCGQGQSDSGLQDYVLSVGWSEDLYAA